jgi:hypothetical protein
MDPLEISYLALLYLIVGQANYYLALIGTKLRAKVLQVKRVLPNLLMLKISEDLIKETELRAY